MQRPPRGEKEIAGQSHHWEHPVHVKQYRMLWKKSSVENCNDGKDNTFLKEVYFDYKYFYQVC